MSPPPPYPIHIAPSHAPCPHPLDFTFPNTWPPSSSTSIDSIPMHINPHPHLPEPYHCHPHMLPSTCALNPHAPHPQSPIHTPAVMPHHSRPPLPRLVHWRPHHSHPRHTHRKLQCRARAPRGRRHQGARRLRRHRCDCLQGNRHAPHVHRDRPLSRYYGCSFRPRSP